MPSRALSDLHPMMEDKARRLVALCKADGIELLITCTLRTFAEQAELYAQGRTKPGKRVTNAKPGKSWHQFGLAFDCVPLLNGKPMWNSTHWERIGALGERLELIWGGRWKIKDRCHFEWHPNLTLAEAHRRHQRGEPLIV
jgi:peptidoglycan LD-endopeptidase CwlK